MVFIINHTNVRVGLAEKKEEKKLRWFNHQQVFQYIFFLKFFKILQLILVMIIIVDLFFIKLDTAQKIKFSIKNFFSKCDQVSKCDFYAVKGILRTFSNIYDGVICESNYAYDTTPFVYRQNFSEVTN